MGVGRVQAAEAKDSIDVQQNRLRGGAGLGATGLAVLAQDDDRANLSLCKVVLERHVVAVEEREDALGVLVKTLRQPACVSVRVFCRGERRKSLIQPVDAALGRLLRECQGGRLAGSIVRRPQLPQMCTDRTSPLRIYDAEVHRVALDTPHQHVIAKRSLAVGADALDGCLRAVIAAVGLELNAQGAQHVKGVLKEKKFALGVDERSLEALAQPGPADFQRAVSPLDVQVTRRARDTSITTADDGKGDPATLLRFGSGVVDPHCG